MLKACNICYLLDYEINHNCASAISSLAPTYLVISLPPVYMKYTIYYYYYYFY